MKNTIKQLIWTILFKNKLIGTIVAIVLALGLSLFSSITPAKAATNFDATYVLDYHQAIPLILNCRKVEIMPGLAQVDLNKVNVDHDPEAIKTFIEQIAPEYGVDWKLVYAIGFYESGNYSSSLARNSNNFFGRKATSSTWMSYNTAEDGIRDQFVYMKTHYIDRGLDTPTKMNPIYCEGNTWQYMVQAIMNKA